MWLHYASQPATGLVYHRQDSRTECGLPIAGCSRGTNRSPARHDRLLITFPPTCSHLTICQYRPSGFVSVFDNSQVLIARHIQTNARCAFPFLLFPSPRQSPNHHGRYRHHACDGGSRGEDLEPGRPCLNERLANRIMLRRTGSDAHLCWYTRIREARCKKIQFRRL